MQALKARALKAFKATGLSVGLSEICSGPPGLWSLSVENDGEYSSSLSDYVRAADPMTIITETLHPGRYDWAADVYIKPVNILTVKF